jgi:pimeloyl-ACP methyl ester carboxylesterase
VVFLNSLFGGPTEDPDPFGRPTFPLTLNDRSGSDALWRMSSAAPCDGRIIPGTPKQVWEQTMENETVGREWGGDDPTKPPIGLNRAPTFSGYGWNPVVAGQLSTPTLVMQGLKDGVLPTAPGTTPGEHAQAIYDAIPAYMTNKVLVKVECASHALLWEGCTGAGLQAGPGDDALRREARRPLGWPPCHAQGSADRVDQEWGFQRRRERFLHRQREWRGEARALRSRAVAVPYGLARQHRR